MELENKARELSDMLINSDVYKRYLAAKENLEKNRELMQKVTEYRRRNFFIQNDEHGNKYEAIRNLSGEYYDVLTDRYVKEFLDCEVMLCRTVQNINNIIVEKLDFDIGFIE